MDDEALYQIEMRCLAASAGPWISYVEGRDHQSGSNLIKTGARVGHKLAEFEVIGATTEDQDFIANARQNIPLLLEEIARLKSACAGGREGDGGNNRHTTTIIERDTKR
jgi:hypothetical protein